MTHSCTYLCLLETLSSDKKVVWHFGRSAYSLSCWELDVKINDRYNEHAPLWFVHELQKKLTKINLISNIQVLYGLAPSMSLLDFSIHRSLNQLWNQVPTW